MGKFILGVVVTLAGVVRKVECRDELFPIQSVRLNIGFKIFLYSFVELFDLCALRLRPPDRFALDLNC